MAKSCKNTMPLILMLMTTGAGAQSNLHAIFNPRIGQLPTTASFSSRIDEQADTKDQDQDIAITHYKFNLMTPLRQDEQSELALTTGLSVWDIATTARLSEAKADLPDHLWNPSFGGFYRQGLDDDRMAGFLINISSPSDRPFASGHEIAVNASAFLRTPADQRNAWYYFLNFSNNRDFLNNVPLPGLGYLYQPDQTLQVMLGAPLCTVRWAPREKLTVEAMYMFLRTLHAKVSYELSQRLKIYGGFDWQSQRWFRADRDDHNDRLFYYEKRVTAGVKVALNENMELDLSGGYSFDRFFFEGEDYDDRDENRISLSDGPFAAIATNLRF